MALTETDQRSKSLQKEHLQRGEYPYRHFVEKRMKTQLDVLLWKGLEGPGHLLLKKPVDL